MVRVRISLPAPIRTSRDGGKFRLDLLFKSFYNIVSEVDNATTAKVESGKQYKKCAYPRFLVSVRATTLTNYSAESEQGAWT